MKKRTAIWKRLMALILVVTLLPVGDVLDCFTLRVHAEEAAEEMAEESASEESDEMTEESTPEESDDISGADDGQQSDLTEEAEEAPWTLAEDYTLAQNTEVSGIVLTGGTLDLNGYRLTVEGDFVQTAGTAFINGGDLIVGGDYLLQAEDGGVSTGVLKMVDEYDYVKVEGSYISRSKQSSYGRLTNGTLEVGGDFIIEAEAVNNFYTGGNHTLLLSGKDPQKISFATSRANGSHIVNLKITNQSEDGVLIGRETDITEIGDAYLDIPCITGKITDTEQKAKGTVRLGTGGNFEEGYFKGNVLVGESAYYIPQELVVDGDVLLDSFGNSYYDVNISGSLKINGNLYQKTSTVKMDNGRLDVEGDYTVVRRQYRSNANQQFISMVHASDQVHIHGDVSADYGSYMYMTAGILEAEGNLSTTGAIQASGSNKLLLSGYQRQTIIVPENSRFATIELDNHSEDGVFSETLLQYEELITNGSRISYGDYSGEYGWTLEEDSVYEGNLILLDNTLDLNGHTLTVNGDLLQTSGTIYINGGKLIVNGDYRMEVPKAEGESGKSLGHLKMIQEDDHVCVEGNFVSTSVHNSTGSLTAGVLEVKGDFTVNTAYSEKGFAASDNHTLLLSGEEKQTVSFGKSGSQYSRLANVEFRNTSEEGVEFLSDKNTENVVHISGAIKGDTDNITGYIEIGAGTTFENEYYGGDVSIRHGLTLEQTLTIGGDLELKKVGTGSSWMYIRGKLTVKGNVSQTKATLYMQRGSLEIEGDYIISSDSYLSMEYDQDYIHVIGNVSCNSNSCRFAKGVFEIGGDFTSEKSFVAQPQHKFVFFGTGKQVISTAEGTQFGVVELKNESEEGVYSETVFARVQLISNGNRITYENVEGVYGWTLEENRVYEGDLVLLDDTLDLNGHNLTVTGNLIQNAGEVYIHGGSLTVEGDYRMQTAEKNEQTEEYDYGVSAGYLKMVHETDRVCIKGSYLSDSASNATDCLTAGIMEVQGDFVVDASASDSSFVATKKHTILLSGTGKQTVRFSKSTMQSSRLNNVEIMNNSEDGVCFDSDEIQSDELTYHQNTVLVSGNVDDHGNHVNGMIGIGRYTTFENNSFHGSVYIADAVEVKEKLYIGGDMEITLPEKNNSFICIMSELSVDGNLTQTEGGLILQKGTLEVSGNYVFSYTGTNSSRDYTSYKYDNNRYYRGILWTAYDEDHIHIHGDVVFTHPKNKYYDPLIRLYAGTLEIEGNLTSTGFINAQNQSRVLFSGDKKQTISAALDKNTFAVIEFKNSSEEGVHMESRLSYQKLITNGCHITCGEYEGEYGRVLEEDYVCEGDLVLIEGVLDLNGHALMVKGDLVQMSGSIYIHGGNLTVEGDYRIQSREKNEKTEEYVYGSTQGYLQMTDSADHVYVNGSFISSAVYANTDMLTAGTLEVKGDFIVNNGYTGNGFIATQEHTLLLSGSQKQTVQVKQDAARICNLEITNTSEEGVYFDSVATDKDSNIAYIASKVYVPCVTGNVNDHKKVVSGYIRIVGSTEFTDNYFGGSIYAQAGETLEQELYIAGDLEFNGIRKYSSYYYYYYDHEYVHITGNITVGGNVYHGNKYVYFDKGQMEVYGDYVFWQVTDNSALFMKNEEDYIHVHGDVNYNPSYEASSLTAGTFEVEGDLHSTKNLNATGTHRFLFTGDKLQTIDIAENEKFAVVELNNHSEEGVYSDTAFSKTTLIRNGCKLRYGDVEGEYGWTLIQDQVYRGDLVLLDDTLDLNGYTLTVTGNLTQVTGVININGGTLIVQGDYRIQSRKGEEGSYAYGAGDGKLLMTQTEDKVVVEGNLTIQSSQSMSGFLTAGTLELRGNLRQYGSYPFESSGSHTLVFAGSDMQVFRQNVSGRIQRLVNRNTKELSIQGIVYVQGTVADEQGTVAGKGSIQITSAGQLENGMWSGGVTFSGTNRLDRDLVTGAFSLAAGAALDAAGHSIIADSMDIKGKLDIGNARIACAGDLIVSNYGSIVMQKDEGYLLVGGNFLMSGRQNHTGLLTAGTMELRGNFIQTGYVNFVASGTHKVILARKQNASGRDFVQSIHFQYEPGKTKFHKLVLRKTVSNYQFKNDIELISDEILYEIEDEDAPVPVTYIKAKEVTLHAVTIAYDGASDDAGILGYEIWRDGRQIGVTSHKTYKDTSVEPAKTYTYMVYPFDIYRNITMESPEFEVTVPADEEAPTAPSGVSVATRTGSSITLAWNPSSDNMGVASYRVFRNGTEIARDIQELQYEDKELSANTVYHYHVVAYDAAGNASAQSSSVEAVTAMPRITEITPADYSEVGVGMTHIEVKFADCGNSQGNRVTIELYQGETDGEETWKMLASLHQKTYNASTLYAAYDWNLTALAAQEEKDYRLRVTLYDAEENTDVREISYHVDSQAPELPEKFEADPSNGTVSLTWEPSKSADCTVYTIYRKDIPADDAQEEEDFRVIAELEGRYAQTSYTDQMVTMGRSYSYAITVKDAFGNISRMSEPLTVTVGEDKLPPRVTDITPGAGRIAQYTQISVTAEDNSRVASVRLFYRSEDTEEWTYLYETQPYNGVATYWWYTYSLPDGVYYFKAVAIDGNGNESEGEFVRRYEIDNTGISKINITDTQVSSTAVQLRWEDVTEDDFAYFRVEQLVGSYYWTKIAEVKDTLGYQITNLSPNTSYRFLVVGYDNLGNRGEQSDIVEVTTEEDTLAPVIREVYPVEGHYKDALELKVVAADNDMPKKAVFSASTDGVEYQVIGMTWNYRKAEQADFYWHFDISEVPEGPLYIKFEVYDDAENKNALTGDGEEVILQYEVDRTPPAKVKGLAENGTEGYVGLIWDEVADEDVASFKIYRMDGELGIYKVIEAACASKNYYDTNVKPGGTYTYKVSAVDTAGNEGECSAEICLSVKADKDVPVITGMSPADGSTVGADPTLKLAATDNAGLAKAVFSYKRKDSKEEIWTQIGQASMDGRAEMTSVTWSTEGLEEAAYLIRGLVYDKAGNVSAIREAEYTLDITPPAVPVVRTTTGHFQIMLSILGERGNDFNHYEISRREAGYDQYIYIGETAEGSYVDENVDSDKVYFYQVTAVDSYGNTSVSEEEEGIADATDKVAPIAVLPETMLGLVGMELSFDGCDSSDNMRVTGFEWDMGNGDYRSGARFSYSYSEAGDYTVTLTVHDAAGNTDQTTMKVRISEKTGRGTYNLEITDERGNPIPHAYVYMKTGVTTISLKADSTGHVLITGSEGNHQVAAYRTGYLPRETTISISEYSDGNGMIALQKDELIVGNLSVRRMSLEEMVEAGVDFSDPSNMHSFVFELTLVFEEKPIKTTFVCSKDMDYVPVYTEDTKHPVRVWAKPVSAQGRGGEPQEAEEQPILAYVKTTQGVSWLKDMYEVNLGILNAAENQFILKNTRATLNLPPDGVSLAKLYSVQNNTQNMGDIAGQERGEAKWVVRGDKSGSYMLSADVKATLMPFKAPVSAHFELEQEFIVTTGEGLHIYIMPEETAYVGEDYYVQFKIVNESDKPFYNFTTTIGQHEEHASKREVINLATGEKESLDVDIIILKDSGSIHQSIVMEKGREVMFRTLYPGDEFYGTYKETFEQSLDSDKDPEKVYYELIDSFVNVLEGENLGVKVTIQPIEGHMKRYRVRDIITYFADPIDLSRGAFTENIQGLSIMGANELSVEFDYDSCTADECGEAGYGWKHSYEYSIEEHNGTIRFYLSPDTYAYFVKEGSEDGLLSVYQGEDGILVDGGVQYSYGHYVCLNQDMSDYELVKNTDDTYTVTTPAGIQYLFDSQGRLYRLTDASGKAVEFAYSGQQTTLTEKISGKHLYLNYNSDGLIASVTDDNGRKTTFAYDENRNLVAATNALGDTIHYVYDENHRLISENDASGIIVQNSYDENGRVVGQTDILGNALSLTYHRQGLDTVVNITDVDGSTKQAVVNVDGRIIRLTDADGSVTSYEYNAAGNVIKETDREGNIVQREYDNRGRVAKIIDQAGQTTMMIYDQVGNLLSVAGGDGRKASYTYNAQNLMTSSTDFMGVKAHYSYNEDGQLIKETKEGLGSIEYTYEKGQIATIKDYNGNLTTFIYDGAGNLIRTVDSMGNITENTYDVLGHLLTSKDAAGNTNIYTYDRRGNLVSATNELGKKQTYTYDRAGRKIAETYPDGTSTKFAYDVNGNCIKETYADHTSIDYVYDSVGNVVQVTLADGSTVSYAYDRMMRKVTETNAAGSTTAYSYYANGKLKEVSYPDGSKETYAYNAAWEIEKFTDRSGHETAYAYDAMGNMTQMTDALGHTWKYGYDKYGRMISETDAGGNTTKYTYDANGNCTGRTDALGVTAYMEYDALNRLTRAYTKTKAGEVNSISYTYDALGRVLSTTDELGNTTRMTYDAAGNLISTTDAAGVVTETATYDSMGRVNTMKDALGMTTAYSYDTMGNLLQAVKTLNADNSHKTTFTYDTLGRNTSVTDTLEGVTKASYDKQGNVSSITDANGGVTKYQYDQMNRLTAEISPLGSRTSYTYNAAGLLTESFNARKQSTKYSYDAAGRITSMTDELGTVSYTYDANGNILTVTDAQGTINREYDALNRVTKYTDARGNTVKYGYDELGNMLYLEYPGGEIVRCTYYKNGWLQTVTDPAGKVTKYSYDARGNLTHTERPNGTEEICEYNAAGLLTMQKDVRKDAAGREEVLTEYHYSHDAAGNITAIEGTETTGTKEGISALSNAVMTYDADNRLLTYNGETVRYDADGNMTYGPVNGVMSELTYDCRNRLVSAGGVTYTYDAENNRIGMASDRHSESYVVDTVSGSLSRVLMITDGSASTTRCIYGNGLICEETGGVYSYHHYNNLGSTVKLTDADGSVVASFTYGTYGELLSGSTGYTRFLYNGQYGVFTDDNGLYYMRQRYYNPETKRFVNRDILTGSIGKSQSLNRYSYVQGNPVNYTDPFGLSPAAQSFKDVGHWHTMLELLSLIPPVMPYAAGLDAILYGFVDKDPLKAVFFGALSGTAATAKFAVYAAGTSFAKYGKVASQIAKYGEKTVGISGLAISTRDVSDDISKINALMRNSDGITKEILLTDGKLVVDLALVGLFGGSIGKSNKQISGLEKLYENLEPPYKGGSNSSQFNSNLKFGENDMVYGPSANGKLAELQQRAGGKLLGDVGNPYEMGFGNDWVAFSKNTIENTVQAGNKIHFDLTYMDDVAGVLNGTNHIDKVTSKELLYIKENWSRFSNNVKFYYGGKEVMPPWMQ